MCSTDKTILMDLTECADKLGLKPRAISTAIRNGWDIPHEHVNTNFKFIRKLVNRWAEGEKFSCDICEKENKESAKDIDHIPALNIKKYRKVIG